MRALATAMLLCGVGAALSATAEIYSWVDEDGRLHFSQQPPPQGNARGEVSRRPRKGETRREGPDAKGPAKRASAILASLPDDGFVRFTRAIPWQGDDPPLRIELAPDRIMIQPITKVGVERSGRRCEKVKPLYTGPPASGGPLLPSDFMIGMTGRIWDRLAKLGYRGPSREPPFSRDLRLQPHILDLKADGCIAATGKHATSGVEMKVRFELWTTLQRDGNRHLEWSKTVIGTFKGRTPTSERLLFASYLRPTSQRSASSGPPRVHSDAVERAIANAYVDAFDQVLGEQVFVVFLDPVLNETLTTKTATTRPSLPKLQIQYGDGSRQFDYERAKRSTVTVRVRRGHGSGFLISSGDYVMTNEHVIRTHDRATVLFADRQIPAQVVYRHTPRDIAVLKLETAAPAEPLQVAKREPKPGDVIYVVGTPIDERLQHTLTRGIISAHREFKGWRFYQTDAAVNRGNSGGPAFNARGEVVGIAVAGMFSKGGGALSINYLIPIDDALMMLGIPSPNGRKLPSTIRTVLDLFPGGRSR